MQKMRKRWKCSCRGRPRHGGPSLISYRRKSRRNKLKYIHNLMVRAENVFYLTRARLEPASLSDSGLLEPASDLGKAVLSNWVWGQFGVCPQLFRETSRLI